MIAAGKGPYAGLGTVVQAKLHEPWGGIEPSTLARGCEENIDLPNRNGWRCVDAEHQRNELSLHGISDLLPPTRDSCIATISCLFDHLVGADKH